MKARKKEINPCVILTKETYLPNNRQQTESPSNHDYLVSVLKCDCCISFAVLIDFLISARGPSLNKHDAVTVELWKTSGRLKAYARFLKYFLSDSLPKTIQK